MFLAEGELVLGRYRVLRALPAWGELSRWSALDEAQGVEVELCAPSALACLRPGSVEAFREAFSPGGAAVRGLWPPLDLGAHRERPVGVRAAGLRPMAPKIPAALLPTLLSALGPALQRGAARWSRRALVVDPAGQPWVALDGLVDPPPLGAPPLQVGADLWARMTGQPPDGRPAARAAPGLDPAVSTLLDAILVEIPSTAPPLVPPAWPVGLAARDAAEGADGEAPGGPPSLGTASPTSIRSIGGAPSAGRRAARLDPGAALAVLEGPVTDRALRRAAAVLGVDERRLIAARDAGGPVALAAFGAPAEVERLQSALGPGLRLQRRERPWGGAALPVLVALAGLFFGAVGLFGAAFSGGLSTLLVLLFGLAAAVGGLGFAGLRARAVAQAARLERATEALIAAGQPDPLLGAFGATRAAILGAGLPGPAAEDLLELVDELQESLPDRPAPAVIAEVNAQLDAILVGIAEAAEQGAGAGAAAVDVRARAARALAAARG
jgi:hypothetical protein